MTMAKSVWYSTKSHGLLLLVVLVLTALAFPTFLLGENALCTGLLFARHAVTVSSVSPASEELAQNNQPDKGQAFATAPVDGKNGPEDWKDITSLVTGYEFIAGLRSDGTVVADYTDSSFGPGEFDVSAWKDIKEIAASGALLIGLKIDGTVVCTGTAFNDTEDVLSGWKDLVDISAAGEFVVGVRKNGRMVFAGEVFYNEALYSSLRGVSRAEAVACSAGASILAFAEDGTLLNDGRRYRDVSSSGWLSTGIREDGSVYFWGIDAWELQPEMTLWRDIKQVCPGDVGAIGLQNDGRLVLTSTELELYGEAAAWTEIERIFWQDHNYLVGIRKDGSAVAVGYSESNLRDWTDIVDVVYYGGKLFGLRSNGTVVTAESSDERKDSALDYGEYNWDLEDLRKRVTAFDHGWLTFYRGGDMYIPEQFAGSAEPDSDTSIGRTYNFIDYKTNLTLKVTEAALTEYPDVKEESIEGDSDWDYTTEYYVTRDGKRTDFISAKFAELKAQYEGADYKKCEKEYCIISGRAANYAYYIRYQVRNNSVYSLCFLYPPAHADECRPVVEQIETLFLT